MATDLKSPVYQEFMNPILAALQAVGGTATNDELDRRVAADMKLGSALLGLAKSDRTSPWYRMAWARSYLKKAGFLTNPARSTWSLTVDGRKSYPIDAREVSYRIQRSYGADEPEDVHDDVAPVPAAWPERLAAMRADARFVAHHRERDRRREEVRTEIRKLFADFRDGRITIRELRDTYDRRTRTDWDVFGLKGMSGAMFLNTLVKHLPLQTEQTTQLLKTAMTMPSSEADARARMRALHDRIVELTEAGVVTPRNVQATRVPFFVSSTWHVEGPDEWPAYYESMREPLRDFYSPTENVIETYFRFVEAVRTARAQLGIGCWELEHLCEWLAATTVEPPQPPISGSRVWLLAPGRNADRWDEQRRAGIVAIGWDDLRDLRAYRSLDEVRDRLRAMRGPDASEPTNHALSCWEFAREMQIGDPVFAKKGRDRVVGYGTVASDYTFDDARKDFKHVRRVDWKWTGDATLERTLPMKTLTDVGAYEALVTELRAAVGMVVSDHAPGDHADDDDETSVPGPSTYALDDATRDLFRSREEIVRLRDLVSQRKNVILAGPPGVGKTFVAKRLAWLVAGVRDEALVTTVQFHQSFAYEDFVQGYRPTETGGFERRNGPFLDFCDLAAKRPDRAHVLVIDEINRGNLSKIFGELLMLIEPDKRDPQWKVRLAYGRTEERFFVPPNLHVIGTMNTADRSLAVVDYALRRRFGFVDLKPQLEHAAFEAFLKGKGAEAALVARIRARVAKVNGEIERDPQLGPGYLIGHSYFSAFASGQVPDDEWYERIIDYEIDPLLREYWFDRPDRAVDAVAHLKGGV